MGQGFEPRYHRPEALVSTSMVTWLVGLVQVLTWDLFPLALPYSRF
jgi:hypothetical protein